jgi:cell division protease FtsH
VNNFGKNLALWIVIGLLLVALFNLFQTSSTRGPQSTLAFSDFVTDVNRGQVTDVTIQGNGITGHFTEESAHDLALLLKSGALPAPLKVEEQRTVGAELGADAVKAGQISTLLGATLTLIPDQNQPLRPTSYVL